LHATARGAADRSSLSIPCVTLAPKSRRSPSQSCAPLMGPGWRTPTVVMRRHLGPTDPFDNGTCGRLVRPQDGVMSGAFCVTSDSHCVAQNGSYYACPTRAVSAHPSWSPLRPWSRRICSFCPHSVPFPGRLTGPPLTGHVLWEAGRSEAMFVQGSSCGPRFVVPPLAGPPAFGRRRPSLPRPAGPQKSMSPGPCLATWRETRRLYRQHA